MNLSKASKSKRVRFNLSLETKLNNKSDFSFEILFLDIAQLLIVKLNTTQYNK